MKFYQIALFIFAFNASISLLNSANVFGSYIQPDTQWINSLNETRGVGDYTISNTAIFGDFIKGISIIISALGNATLLLPFFLMNLGVPGELNTVLTAGTWLVYSIALAQFLAGRTIER